MYEDWSCFSSSSSSYFFAIQDENKSLNKKKTAAALWNIDVEVDDFSLGTHLRVGQDIEPSPLLSSSLKSSPLAEQP